MNLWKHVKVTAAAVLAVSLWMPAEVRSQGLINALFWGGANTAHRPNDLNDTLQNYLLFNHGIQLHYRNAAVPVWLHPDSLAQYDVMLVYTTNQNANDLGQARFDILKNWVEGGKVIVALHGSTNTYINNNATVAAAWRGLMGGQFVDHGPAGGMGNGGTVQFTKPEHPSLEGTTVLPPSAASSGGQPFWDEGRRHNQFASDTIMLAYSNYTSPSTQSVPWIWVRPQGEGWVYYNASGHDHQTWARPEFKVQVAQALKWGAEVGNPSGLRGRAAVESLIRMHGGVLHVPANTPHSLCVHDLAGREVMRRRSPGNAEAVHDLTGLSPGTYSVQVLTGEGPVFRGVHRSGR